MILHDFHQKSKKYLMDIAANIKMPVISKKNIKCRENDFDVVKP